MARALYGIGILALLTSAVLTAQEAPNNAPAQAVVQSAPLPDTSASKGPVEILSDTEGVDFKPYMARVVHDVKISWYNLIPTEAMPPLSKQGTVTLEFSIVKNGNVRDLQLVSGSGDVGMDRAAYGGITASLPFAPLPIEFKGESLKVRFTFAYNPIRSASSNVEGPVEILSDTKGVNFGPYMEAVRGSVRKNWYSIIPAEALPPMLKQGKVTVEFAILKDGKIADLHYVEGSGDLAMDRAAYGGITASSPFAPLPVEFKGDSLKVRFTFAYNPSFNTERVRLSEIVVSTQNIPADDNQQMTAAHDRAEALLAEIRSGANFEDIKKNLDDPSAFRGADLGFFQRGELAAPIEDAVFRLKAGDISDVIQTNQGFVILKVTEHISPPAQTSATPARK